MNRAKKNKVGVIVIIWLTLSRGWCECSKI